jgi:hypothetical protein
MPVWRRPLAVVASVVLVVGLGLGLTVLVAAPTEGAGAVARPSNLVNHGTSWCLDAGSCGYTSDGDQIQLWACNSRPEQKWVLTPAGQLQSAGTDYCLDANSSDWPNEGDPVQLWQCNTHPEQLWKFTSAGQLEDSSTGMCLDAERSAFPGDGDGIQLWGCNTHPEQLWAFGTGGATSVGPSVQSVAISWARQWLGQDYLPGHCLKFVELAYQDAGINIGRASSAAVYWSADPEGYQEHPGNADPPVGALVFWAPRYSPYGHVGIYEGNDTVVSTESWPEPGSVMAVHEFSLSGRNADGFPYLGWMLP